MECCSCGVSPLLTKEGKKIFAGVVDVSLEGTQWLEHWSCKNESPSSTCHFMCHNNALIHLFSLSVIIIINKCMDQEIPQPVEYMPYRAGRCPGSSPR